VPGSTVKLRVEFSVTAAPDETVLAAIEAINEDAWTPITYWLSTSEVSGDVAETTSIAPFGTDAISMRVGGAPLLSHPRRAKLAPASELICRPAVKIHVVRQLPVIVA
jgi:hypothetical protein